MKTKRAYLPGFFAALFALATFGPLSGTAGVEETARDLPHAVQFELGDGQFIPGDKITIQQLRGTSETITTGETYCVEGTYTLGSRDEAELAFFTTTISDSGSSPINPRQIVRIKKGTGSFRLVKTLNEDGYLHLSFYPVPSGSDFGGVYFGQGQRVLRNKKFSGPGHPGSGDSAPVSSSGPNQVLLEYLGNPVEPPPYLDARYTRDGLIHAVQLAARNAGITLKKVAIDDSEYPFLVGVVCGGSDSVRLKDQIKKMDGYEYGGSVGNDTNSDGSDTCNAFSIVPYRDYPREAGERIHHRLLLREQVFHARFCAQK